MNMNSDAKPKKGWKDHLLRSGVPLEYEIARILADENMSVDADFSFLRRDGAVAKELSVDMAATWYGPNENKLDYELQLLIECKYRSKGKYILFLEDPNDQFSPVTLGGTINTFDAFTPYHLPRDAFVSLEESLTYVYKGIELHDGDAVEEDLRRGIQQLRYATPASLCKTLSFLIQNEISESMCLFFTKILVTNAPLRIMNRDVNIEKIKSAQSIEDVSRSVQTVILFSDYGPDYEDHFRYSFKEESEGLLKSARHLRDRLQSNGKRMSFGADPVTLIENFSTATRYECRAVGTQFFITSLDGLPRLIKSLKKICQSSYRHKTKTDPLDRQIKNDLKKAETR